MRRVLRPLLILSLWVGLAFWFPALPKANPLAVWNWRNPLPQGNALRGVVRAGELFMALGDAGTLMTSPDGIAWTSIRLGHFGWLKGGAWGEGLYVVTGAGGMILVSGDGATWIPTDSGTAEDLDSVAFGNGLFVAVGDWGTILTSSDGIAWQGQERKVLAHLRAVTWGGGLFVAVGDDNTVLTSPDGEAWEVMTERDPDRQLLSVAYGKGTFVSVGRNIAWGMGMVMTSTGGASWPEKGMALKDPLMGVAFDGALFYAAGENEELRASPDGVTWTAPLLEYRFESVFVAIAFGAGQFVMAGNGSRLLTSSDGLAWTEQSRSLGPHPPVSYGRGAFHILSWADPRAGKEVLTSEDGKTWDTVGLDTPVALYGIEYLKGLFFAWGGGRVFTSRDRVRWTEIIAGSAFDFRAAAFGDGAFVILGDGNAFLRSSDTTSWTRHHLDSDGDGRALNGITYGEGIFVAVGEEGLIATSPDGATWTRQVSGTVAWLGGVAYGKGRFVAVGNETLISENGRGWLPLFQSSLTGILFAYDRFVAFRSGFVMASDDGSQWETTFLGTTRSAGSMAAGKGTLVITGGTGVILQSDPLAMGPSLSAEPAFLDFGSHPAGSGPERSVALTNKGSLPLSIESVTLPTPPFYVAADDCSGRVLAEGEACLLTLRFSPGSLAHSAGMVQIVSNDLDESPFFLSLSGTGLVPDISVSPLSLVFGVVTPGQQSAAGKVTVTNVGSADLHLGAVILDGVDRDQFFLSSDACGGMTLSPGGTCSIEVIFAPAGPLDKRAQIILKSDDPETPLAGLLLMGSGGTPVISVDPGLLDFGNVPPGTSKDETVMVRNGGTAGLMVSSIRYSNSSFHTVGGSCSEGMTLLPGETCGLCVRFTPAGAGSFSGDIELGSDDPARPVVIVSLAGGSGPDLTGEWDSLEKLCRRSSQRQACKLAGVFRVHNAGTGDAGAFTTEFYLSDGEGTGKEGRLLLKRAKTGKLLPGGGKRKQMNLSLPSGETGSGKYILAVVDAEEIVNESNETNNVVVYGPLP
jgi:hypothetical protein